MLLAASGAIALAPLMSACQKLGLVVSPTPTPSLTSTSSATASQTPSPTDTPTITTTPDLRSRVVLVKTRERAAGVRKALELWGQNPVQGKTVALKANFNSANPSPASTHPETLETLANELWRLGATRLTLAERSGSANTRHVLSQLGIFDLAQRLGMDTVVLNEKRDPADWTPMQPIGSHWQHGFYLSNIFLHADAIIQTCCLKPHSMGAITLSLKNAVGMVARYLDGIDQDFMHELHTGKIGTMAAEINFAFSPALVLLDGVEAFISGGPDQGQKVWGDVILAGTDRVALDALGLALLRHLGYAGPAANGPIFQQEQIARAIELGLGVDGPQKINLVTGDAESEAYAAQIMERLLVD
jgi:uncharacterized protein (DUF362 family)